MKNKPYFIKVLLSNKGIIVKFECTLRDSECDPLSVIGKNWFDTFIETTDKETVLKVFGELFDNKKEKWETFGNDIKCLDGTHRRIDFTNEIILLDGIKYLSSHGVEHMNNC